MKKALFVSMLAVTIGLSVPATVFAHATLEQQEAEVDTQYKAVIRIGHGCEGEATLKVRVKIPEGVVSVKPQPKAGWKLETLKGPYERSYDYYGQTLKEGVKEIVWTGELLDEHYDEFVFRGKLTTSLPTHQMLYVPVIQECATKAERWIEIPAQGQDSGDLPSPAPGVMILPSSKSH